MRFWSKRGGSKGKSNWKGKAF